MKDAGRKRTVRALPSGEDGRFGMVGRSPGMHRLYEQIESFSKSDAPLLISGEAGVGKKLVARALHASGPRADGPFLAVPTGSFSEELFGHAPGTFTGAGTSRNGSIVAASGGSLLLDEVECLPPRAQSLLLRVLDEGQVCPPGRDEPRTVDVRFLSTTRTDLLDAVQRRQIREDFYFRIRVLSIRVPPLLERREDIPRLVSHFLREFSRRKGIPVPKVSEPVLRGMLRHSWPGNVRELKNAVERMTISGENGMAGSFKVEESFDLTRHLSLPPTEGNLRREMERTERRIIREMLFRNRGEINTTAQGLGISRRALYTRMKKYGLSKKDFRS